MSTFAPPPNLDAAYQPFAGAAAWIGDAAVLHLFDQVAADFATSLDMLSKAQRTETVDFAVRAAAFDTGAIEGLYHTDRGVTFSVAAQTAAWEAQVAQEAGRDATSHFASQLRGFELVLDAATTNQPISAAWLRALHETICRGQPTYRALTAIGWQDIQLPLGEFKRLPNHVLTADGSWHSYAPADSTTSEVQRLVDQLAGADFAQLRPAAQAAFVHCALIAIHPFADGNGRVARAVASTYLYRAAKVPLLVFADQRPRYLRALRAVDGGDNLAFVRFTAEAAVETMELLMAEYPDSHDHGHTAQRLGSTIADSLNDELGGIGEVRMTGSDQVDIAYPGMINATVSVDLENELWPVRVVAADPDQQLVADELRFRWEQLRPALSAVTRERVHQWARRVARALNPPKIA